jgi:hypothetical protein
MNHMCAIFIASALRRNDSRNDTGLGKATELFLLRRRRVPELTSGIGRCRDGAARNPSGRAPCRLRTLHRAPCGVAVAFPSTFSVALWPALLLGRGFLPRLSARRRRRGLDGPVSRPSSPFGSVVVVPCAIAQRETCEGRQARGNRNRSCRALLGEMEQRHHIYFLMRRRKPGAGAPRKLSSTMSEKAKRRVHVALRMWSAECRLRDQAMSGRNDSASIFTVGGARRTPSGLAAVIEEPSRS